MYNKNFNSAETEQDRKISWKKVGIGALSLALALITVFIIGIN